MKRSYQEIESIQNQESKKTRLPVVGVLENIRSLYNVGSMFRTAEGAGIMSLTLTGFTGSPPSKEIEKTALGSTEFLPWVHCETTPSYLKSFREPVTTIALEHSTKSIPYTEIDLPMNRPIVLVVGNEITGVAEETLELCSIHTEIPMYGKKHSLNVAVAFGILIYHLLTLLRR